MLPWWIDILGGSSLTAPSMSKISHPSLHIQEEIKTFKSNILYWDSSRKVGSQRVPSKTLFLWSSVWQEDCTEVQNIKISSANSMLYLQGSYHGQWQWWEYRKSQLPHVQIRGKKLADLFYYSPIGNNASNRYRQAEEWIFSAQKRTL